MANLFSIVDNTINMLDAEGFAKLLGTTPTDIERICGPLLREYDFRYVVLNNEELYDTLLEVSKTIDNTSLSSSGKDRLKDWEEGWEENLRDFVGKNYDLSALVPKYMHKFKIRRLFLKYIRPFDNDFEVNFYSVYRYYLFKKYLQKFECIYEFGCGTGYNLVIMAQLFPDKKLFGLDWAEASVKLVNTIATVYGFNLKGRRFDYFHPDYTLDIPENSAFITLNSMEQIGTNYDMFLNFTLKKKPALCINSEPILELYDENNLLDYLAMKYHIKRNYLKGYLNTLKKLEQNGKVEILQEQRVQSGNMFHDGYSIVIWRIL